MLMKVRIQFIGVSFRSFVATAAKSFLQIFIKFGSCHISTIYEMD